MFDNIFYYRPRIPGLGETVGRGAALLVAEVRVRVEEGGQRNVKCRAVEV